MSRFLVVVMLAIGIILAGCAPPDSQDEGTGNKPRAEKVAEEERPADEKPSELEKSDPETDANTATEKKEQSKDSGAGKPDEKSTPKPEKVLASQYRHINVSNYGAAYDLFDYQSKRLVSLEQYSAYFTSAAPYEITDDSFSSVQVQGGAASVGVDLTVSSSGGQERYEVTQRLVREGGSWRVVMRDEQVASFTAADNSSPSASASDSASPSASGDYDVTVTVSRVVDGDTIEISPAINGVEDVRLIGMDTPETVDPGEEIEPLGPEASAFATDGLTGQSVGLEFDVERKDQYDRLLAYVFLEGKMFNEVLVEKGLAQAYPYEPNTRYEGRLAAAQDKARAAGLGIWGLTLAQQCQLADRGNSIGKGTVGCSGSSASSSANSSATAASSAAASAGSGGSAPAAPDGEGDIDCDQVNGPIPTPPGDPDGLDGDGDGLACE